MNTKILILILATFYCSDFETLGQMNTQKITDKTIYELINNNEDKIVVILFVQSCPHCDKFRPVFYNSVYDHKDHEMDFAELNCREHQEVCKDLGVDTFPSIYIFKNGKMYFHGGSLDKESLKQFYQGGWQELEGLLIGKNKGIEIPQHCCIVSQILSYLKDYRVLLLLLGGFFLWKFFLSKNKEEKKNDYFENNQKNEISQNN